MKPMTFEEAQAKVATLQHPRVTKEYMEAKIYNVDYLNSGMTTICIITMSNGFKVIGHSTPASSENFDADVGRAYAYDNAFRQLWQLEGYLLREKLSANDE